MFQDRKWIKRNLKSFLIRFLYTYLIKSNKELSSEVFILEVSLRVKGFKQKLIELRGEKNESKEKQKYI